MLHTNIIHRIDTAADSLEALEFQLSSAAQFELSSTNLLTYPALRSPAALEVAHRLAGDDQHELGLHFHGFQCAEVEEKFGTRESAFWLLPQAVRAGVIDRMMEDFNRHFGRLPVTVGCYILDAWTLNYIKQHYPGVRAAISNCFEEGVKMYHGNNHAWNLFSDGGPWGPFYPSRTCALIPARDPGEAIDLVALPHLSRDMLLALTSRDDYYASHPGNLLRARINHGSKCAYMTKLVDAWMRQSEWNGWSYLSVFVSAPWLLQRHWTVENVDDVRSLYVELLGHIAHRRSEGKASVETIASFAREFTNLATPGSPTVCHWRDELSGSPREIAWVANPHYRAAIDLNAGGAIADLRPYVGQLNLDLGPETPNLWNGNHPFVLSAELRGGLELNSQHFILTHRGESVRSIERRTKATLEQATNSKSWVINCEPCRYQVGDLTVTVASQWRVDGGPRIGLRRTITALSDEQARVTLTEVIVGTWGKTDYPEPGERMTGVLLTKTGPQSRQLDLSGMVMLAGMAEGVEVRIHEGRCAIGLVGESVPREAKLTSGTLFLPNYRLELGQQLGFGESLTTWLTINPLDPCA